MKNLNGSVFTGSVFASSVFASSPFAVLFLRVAVLVVIRENPLSLFCLSSL